MFNNPFPAPLNKIPEKESKTYVYVDGFNLYYGALYKSPNKWLDLHKMCQLLLPSHNIAKIKYFTANVSARPYDTDQPIRQQIYHRALRTIPNLEIILGSFLTKQIMAPLALPIDGKRFAKIIRTDEKGSDVNLAVHLLHDAYQKHYDTAVIISNDSDLAEAIRIVKNELGIKVGILNPHKYSSTTLRSVASFQKRIRSGVVRISQFSDTLTDTNGTFQKPSSW